MEVVSREDLLIGSRREGDLLAVRQRDFRELDIRGAELLEDGGGGLVEPRAKGE